MRKNIQNFLLKYFFTDTLALENRIINLVLVFGVLSELIVIVVRVIEGVSSFAVLAVAGMMLLTIAAFWICNRFAIHRILIWIIAFLIFNVFFPLVFFTNGGARSGMAGYFVLCLTLIFFLFRGTLCLVLCVIHIAVMTGCYLADRFFPQLIVQFHNDTAMYIDIVHTILVAGLLSGLLVKFQTRLYEIEKEKAEAASRAKAEFLAKVSHELRTPLNAVIGLGELELNRKTDTAAGGDKSARENLEKIYNSGMILLNIINDLLDISKIESGRFELIPVEYETASFINDTVNLNMVRIGSKPIEFKIEIDEKIPVMMRGDELRVRQILNNLLSNAFKYTREGTVWFRIKPEPADDHSGQQSRRQDQDEQIFRSEKGEKFILACSVEDTGIGIKEEDLERIFTLYEQVNAKSNRHIEGTGLGLSICKSMTELMGGTIDVKSKYGEGSIFSVRIPQEAADPRPIGSDLAKNLASFRFNDKKRQWGDKMRNFMPYGKVLIVDDVPTNLDVAKGMMLPYGLVIDCVGSGKETIELVREQKITYDVIFMDHMMPEMDGIEALRIIRNEIGTKYAETIPVIALTANAIIGNEEMFLNEGFQDYLTKPIDSSKLDIVLNKWVRNKEKEKSADWKTVIKKMNGEKSASGKSSEEEQAVVEPHPLIQGIDYAEGLKRMGNQEDAYIRILRSYAEGMPAMLEKIQRFSEETLADYRITIHGIKGSSYGVSANETGHEAEALETAAKDNDLETISANNDNFIIAAKNLVERINNYLEKL